MNKTMRVHIDGLLQAALDDAQHSGVLPPGEIDAPAVERPQNPDHGDFASSLPLKLARPMRMNPMEIAEKLVPLVPIEGALERVWAAPPGFINFSLSPHWLAQQVNRILDAGDRFGSVDAGKGERVQVEFVSVNPTGPLHIGHARGAVIGSALANVLEATGYDVEREYYINDAGNQMDRFNESLLARYRQLHGLDADVSPDGYLGEYMVDLAREIREEVGDRFLFMSTDRAMEEVGEIGLKKMVEAIQVDLETLGVRFDVWFSEQSLYSDGQYDEAMQLLEQNSHIVRREGASWFASSALGEDKDAVLVRSTGVPTYFATDVAYHYNKFVQRGFDHVIDIWGADHQGHVSRMKAVVAALGIPPEKLTLMISQMVSLKRRDELVKVSKRAGEIVTLRELVEEVGADACRYFFLSRSPESQMEFDLDLAKKESSENPVYYVQYAHARITSILGLARERGIDYSDGDVALLTHDAELALIRKMVSLPELIEMMAANLEPHHLPHYSLELATAFHWFYQQCRVVSSEPADAALTKARLKLVDAARTVLARCLGLMQMAAPDQM